MNLNDLKVDQLGLITYVDAQEHNIEELYKVMRLGIVGGLEIRKLSQVSTCAEYRVEGCSARIVIDNNIADYIKVDPLDETIE